MGVEKDDSLKSIPKEQKWNDSFDMYNFEEQGREGPSRLELEEEYDAVVHSASYYYYTRVAADTDMMCMRHCRSREAKDSLDGTPDADET